MTLEDKIKGIEIVQGPKFWKKVPFEVRILIYLDLLKDNQGSGHGAQFYRKRFATILNLSINFER